MRVTRQLMMTDVSDSNEQYQESEEDWEVSEDSVMRQEGEREDNFLSDDIDNERQVLVASQDEEEKVIKGFLKACSGDKKDK